MPINRCQIRNEYSMADPELYKASDKDDPEALLEGVAMSGLVGVLRQLGDLAEFAAEIFHDLHEEVMATATRSKGLLVRVQKLELEIPSIERASLSQTCHSPFFSNSGVDWHPNRQTTQSLITTGDLPRFVMDSYEDCRGPPRLFLLDKFDVGGDGACLKRYTDKSFYKVEASSYEIENAKTQKDRKIRKMKKKISRLKGGETPEVSQTSHVKLHQLFLEEPVQAGAIEPACHVKLKKRPNKFAFELESGESYMNKFLNSSLEDKLVHEVPICLTLSSDSSNGSMLELLEDSTVGSRLGSAMQSRSPWVASSSLEETVCEDLTSRLEILEDSMVGSTLGSAMQSRSPWVASSSVEETVCEDLTSRPEIFEEDIMGFALGSAMQSRSSSVASSSVEETICGDNASRLEILETGTVGSASGEAMQNRSPYVSSSSVEDTECIYPTSRLELLDDSIVGSTLDSAMEIKRPCVASSSVEETICGDPTSRLEMLEYRTMGSTLGSAMQIKSPCVASSSVQETVCGDPTDNLSAEGKASELPSLVEEEADEKQMTVAVIKTDSLQNSYLSDDVASETDDYVDALGTMDSELETEHRVKTGRIIDKGIYSDANIDQLQSQSSGSQSSGNLTASDDGNFSPTRTFPPKPSACIEIPFHPRVPPRQVSSIAENIPFPDHNITNNICLDVIKVPDVSSAIDSTLHVDQVVIFEEGTSKEADSDEMEDYLTSPRKKEEHEPDLEVNVDGHSMFSFVRNSDDVDNKHLNDTIHRISENMFSQVEECAEHDNNNSTGSAISRCSSSDSVISLVDEQSFGPSLAEHGIHDVDVEASDTDDILEAEVTADSPPEMYSLPGEQLQEIRDDHILHISDSEEATVVSYSIKDDEIEESSNRKIQLTTGVVSDFADANRSRVNGGSFSKDEVTLEKREIESFNSEIRAGGNPVCVPDDVDRNEEGIDLSMLEDYPELERRRADSLNSEMEKSADVPFAVDAYTNEDDNHSEPDDQSVMSRLSIVHDSKESGRIEEEDQLLVTSPDSDYSPSDDDSSSKLLFDRIPDVPLACDDMNDSPPSLNSKILQEHTRSFLAETADPNGLQNQPEDIAPFGDLSNVGLLDAPDSTVLTEAEHDDGDHIYVFEAAESSSMEDKVNRPNNQIHLASQLNFLTNVDHETHDDAQSKPSYPVNLASQSVILQEEDLEQKPKLDLRQVSNRDIKLSEQVRHQSVPVFPGLGILPQSAPVQSEHTPPLPPLPPMQWRRRELPNALLTPIDGGQHSHNHFPPIFPSKPDEGPQVVGLPTLDEITNSDTENQKSQHGNYEDLSGEVRSFSPMVLPAASLHTEDHVKSPASPEASFAENLLPQAAIEKEHSRTVPTTSGQEIFWPSSNPYSKPPAEEMPSSIQPTKIPHIPLIDADDANDRSSASSEEDGSINQMVLPEASLHAEDRVKTSASTEAKYAESLMPQAAPDTEHSHSVPTTSGQEVYWPSSKPYSIPLADEMPTSIHPVNLQPPRSPLIGAVAAHDKNKLRKVSDRTMTQVPKGELIDKLMEQIRAKSYNLKPAVQTSPSIQGRPANLRVAALLEKASAIRQAFAGSDDDDDDSDSWSDS